MSKIMSVMNFSQVQSFKIFVPEKTSYLKYSQSWAEPGTWLCNFSSQEGKVEKTALLDTDQVKSVWERFCAAPTCETTYYSSAAK